MKKISLLLALLMIMSIFVCTSCDSNSYSKKQSDIEGATNYVKFEMVNGGSFVMELHPEAAPLAVRNFQKLISEKFYDGIIFHRIWNNQFIQAGDPTGTGYGGSSETIKGEFAANGVKNPLSHVRGAVSMGRKGNSYDSASSHFFICTADMSKAFDGNYAPFAMVIEGMDVVDEICATKTDSNERPVKEQKIKCAYFIDLDNSNTLEGESK